MIFLFHILNMEFNFQSFLGKFFGLTRALIIFVADFNSAVNSAKYLADYSDKK